MHKAKSEQPANNFLQFLSQIEPIQNLLLNMKSFEYSFHHNQLMHAAMAASIPRRDPEMALDLTKPRRDSLESDTMKSSSYEESPNTRESPHSHLLQRNLPKLAAITPEHTVQYHYKYAHSSPTTTTSAIQQHPSSSQSPPLPLYEKFDAIPMMQKIHSPVIEEASKPKNFPLHYDRYNMENSPLPPIIRSPMIQHEDSNELPSANISSSSSVASSQKSPTSSITSNPSRMIVTRDGKISRPFKAYPRDPLSLASASSLLDSSSAEKYAVFRKRMLEQIHAANGGSVVVNNPKMRRISHNKAIVSEETNNNELEFMSDKGGKCGGGSDKDEAYFERRKKNNAAAKKSRDRRRIKEDEIAIRAAYLERENIELKFELAAVRKQLGIYTNGHSS